MRAPEQIVLLAALFLMVAVAAARGFELPGSRDATDPQVGTAPGEVLWYRWSQRHPSMTAGLERAAGRVPGGARVEWVLPARVDGRWVEIMAFYHLPSAWTVAVRPRGTPPPREVRDGRAGVTHRVHLLPGGEIGVRELSPLLPEPG